MEKPRRGKERGNTAEAVCVQFASFLRLVLRLRGLQLHSKYCDNDFQLPHNPSR